MKVELKVKNGLFTREIDDQYYETLRGFSNMFKDRQLNNLLKTLNIKQKDLIRFLSKIKVNSVNGCWEWMNFVRPDGYAMCSINNKKLYCHRISYQIFKGKITNGLEIDHLCGNKKCVNPNHLEVVNHYQNMIRSLNKLRPNCPQGHEYNEENTYISSKGKRDCKKCSEIYILKLKEKYK